MHLNHLNDLTSAHDYGKLSFIFNTNNEEPFIYTEYDEKLNRRIYLRPPFKHHYIFSSCNGLICFNARDDLKPAYICNPITREYIVLPKVEGKYMLAGFGYSTSTKEYKVVSVCKSRGDPNSRIVYVYTLGSGTGWRYVTKMEYDVIFDEQIGAFVNGAVHWLSKGGTIVAFDLDDEEFCELPPPPCLPGCGTRPFFGTLLVIGDSLCTYYKFKRGVEIWFLKKRNNTGDVIWSEEFSHVNVIPITFTNSGWLLCYDCGAKNVYRYVPTWSSSNLLGNFGPNFQFGIPHTNTLLSLKALGEDTKQMDTGETARFKWDTESRSQQKRRKIEGC